MSRTQDPTMAVNIPSNAPPHVYAAAAEQFLEWGRPDGALQVSELGLQRHPSYAGLRLFRAEALLLDKRLEQGEDDLRTVLVAEPQHPRALKLLCHLLTSQRRYREALPILERAEFILMGDKDIPEWLATAEKAVEEEDSSPPPPPTPTLIFSADLADTRDLSERLDELVALPGVCAASLVGDHGERHAGSEWAKFQATLGRLPDLEERMGAILEEAGFGRLVDVALNGRETILMSHRGAHAAVRVAAESHVREGLIAWQCRKTLGEAAE